MKRSAVIVGSGGQDGRLLMNLLNQREYAVSGLTRGNFDIFDAESVTALISSQKPSEVYYLAAHHHSSENVPDAEGKLFHESMKVHFHGAVNFLDAIATYSPASRFFYASSSHVFGSPQYEVHTEDTPLSPESVYAITKVAGMMACKRYRQSKGVYACVGILYNHESPLRGMNFVTTRIADAAARIHLEGSGVLELGNLDACIDWGYAPDYVDAMHRMLQLDKAGDFVVATGEAHTVRDFARVAFGYLGLDYQKYVVIKPQRIVRNNPKASGDSSKLRRLTGWRPSITFEDMVHVLVDSRIAERRRHGVGDRSS